MAKLKDLVEMRWDGKKVYHIGTPFTNLPFTLLRFKKRVFEGNSGVKSYKSNTEIPKGTFYMIIDNGKSPLEILNKK